MDHQQADAVPVTEGFQPGHDLVVAGVAVSIPAEDVYKRQEDSAIFFIDTMFP